MLGTIKKLAIISNNKIMGTISFGGRIKDKSETLDAQRKIIKNMFYIF